MSSGVFQLSSEIRAAVETAAGHAAPAPMRKFNKDDEFIAYGLKTDVWRNVMRRFRARIKALSLEDRLDLADKLFRMRIGELGHSAIYALALSGQELGPQHIERLDRIAEEFTGWSHVDDFCITVAQPLLRAYRPETLTLLERWNRSPNRWKRRASVVAFVRKVGESGQFTKDALR
ncbi:MAG TPA: DNA alkylation repair protein, partial [Gemmatimonadales bacterium]|nr:DNA alkylation repair protein [Gemmatimonadales bacterium]